MRVFSTPGRIAGLEVEGRCQAMQALMPLGSRFSAFGTPLQAAQGTHSEGRVFPIGACATMAILGSCLPFFATGTHILGSVFATGTCHHAQDGVAYPLHPLFSSGVAIQPLQASQAFPFWHYSAEIGKSHISNKSQRTEPGRRILSVILFTFSSLPALSSNRPHGDLHISSCRFCLKWANCVHCGCATDPWGKSPCLLGAEQLFIGFWEHQGTSGN